MLSELDHPTPDLEDLAAYVDGRLDGERKVRVEEHLLRDEDFYEVFLATVRAQQEHVEEVTAGAEPLIRRWHSWWSVAPLAAAAALAALIGWPRPEPPPSFEVWTADLNAPTVLAIGEDWSDPGWPRLRSGTIPAGRYTAEALAFRLGVRTIDLRIALDADDRATAHDLVSELADLTEAAELISSQSLYQQLRGQLSVGDPQALRAQAARAEELLLKSSLPGESLYLVFGGWAEAGRLATRIRDTEALAALLRARPPTPDVEEIAPHLEILGILRNATVPNTADLDTATEAFNAILLALAG